MNALLLAQLVREIRNGIVDYPLGMPAWFAPVLTIPVYGRGFLVAILESPGPFLYVTGDSPFEGADAPRRMTKLAGATVTGIGLDEARVFRLDALTRDEERVTLRVALFGAAGSAALIRDATVMETVGKGRDIAPGDTRFDPPPPLATRFYLVAHGNLGGVAPTQEARSTTEGAQTFGPFPTARLACADVGARVLEGAHAAILHRVTRPLRKRVESLAKLSQNLEADIVRAAGHEELRREAETLAAFQTRVPNRAPSIELPDVYDATRTRVIALDPAESVPAQIEKRFRRAAKLQRSADHAARRLELVREEHSGLSGSLAVLEKSATFSDALKTLEAIRAKFDLDLVEAPRPKGAPQKRAAEKSYRSFNVDANWFVLVGRSNFENDELTFQAAKPNDYWFHAQGVAGSHVVLKSRGGNDAPPARVIERTASIAAHFSKAKHSTLVPVIYTQRKYVRKFRGALPGQVTCEREKMVMVPPLLPDRAES